MLHYQTPIYRYSNTRNTQRYRKASISHDLRLGFLMHRSNTFHPPFVVSFKGHKGGSDCI